MTSKTVDNRIVLNADEGMILTNGSCFGKIVYLSSNTDASQFYEITQQEYDDILKLEETNLFRD